uniref:Peptidyl-prolyl cis-trans isomerase n=1 Tax=Eucampia antarctica TaxID=49252 RepID=A0A7S2SAQ7_9STRA|mmetsp:Transcript_4766/g.4492  ORF Transcript_4766/g.4492 Transcript_4766/m.4492 type:complete len:290 (+) Transcript_4766:166-1035(+)|eukprot:CAMPEP_0197836962 /NCGR_PEP_ID=MMETSP1437-20131217/30623_1 /TAXON_ID=49252 ORGANISM="Eucampia antarctica, Strain CCMP1452" /NCGR_SAMPLE_ID=MMETSP1437 /ASSEMBLY_ACC=CAM_ASM_001096 /LENGTH=289 /DNA_ID=CAMNT_0043443581 /DNA_START=159 /DNA_END=1028 /DNA_ORIENTATION=+
MLSSTKSMSAVCAVILHTLLNAPMIASFQMQNVNVNHNSVTVNNGFVVKKNLVGLRASNNNEDDYDFDMSRRSAFQNTVGNAAVTLLASTAAMFPGMAMAEEEAAAAVMVEFTVQNLDGEEGKTGKVVIRTRPDWAPKGAARFEELADKKFWDGCRIFRVLPGFVSQFGINGDPTTQSYWRSKSLKDDPVKVSNKRGTVVFATSGPNTRTTQMFINTGDRNDFLDKQGFSPCGEVVEGMDIVDRFYSGYGEGAPSGKGPNQGTIQSRGNEYLQSSFPKLTYFSKATIVK